MAIVIRPYTEEWIPEVKAFNARLAAGGVHDFGFYENPLSDWLPDVAGRPIFEQFFLATEDTAVRGGYIVKQQDFSFSGDTRAVGYYHLPLSEALVDRKYSTVGLQMLRTALKCQPSMYCLGMGGPDRPLPRMLKALNWSMWPVPFHFKVLSPGRFLRQMRVLRRGGLVNLALDAAAWSGAGWAAVNLAQRWRAGWWREREWDRRPRLSSSADRRGRLAHCIELFQCFGDWADDLWERVSTAYSMIGVRDAQTLNILYPGSNDKFIRLRVQSGDETIGWAVALDTAMRGDKYFGNLRVGSIIDCLAPPEHASAVVAAAAGVLEERGVDLIVSNQAHESWSRACVRAGFLSSPSNFLFAASPELVKLSEPLDRNRGGIHLTRGDGDGPIHL